MGMSTMTGTLSVPAGAAVTKSKARVDYQKTEEAALVRRAQAGDEMAFGQIESVLDYLRHSS